MISRLIVKAALVGFAASIAVAAPAAAATTPTLSGPAEGIGFSKITLTGTAAPNATVTLYETAYTFDDLQPADDWENNPNNPVTATADAQGRFTIQRWLDSGFYFQVAADGLRSNKITVYARQLPELTNLASPGANTVTATVTASPGQPGLVAELQRQVNGTWTKVGEAVTSQPDPVTKQGGGVATITATGVSGGTGSFRAYVNGDTKNAVRAGGSAAQTLTVDGTVTQPTTPTTPPTTPPTPTTPTPKPTPTAPAPGVGSVQFTRIQYDSPGKDSGTNASLTAEWAKLTNKTRSTINLRGWTVRDAAGHLYTFTTNAYLGGGQSLFVITGKGTNTTVKKHWNRAGRGGYVWNNTGDTAYLRSSSGRTIDSCQWTKAGRGYSNC